MATIIEIQDSKIEHLSEYAEKVVKYGKHLLECLDEVREGEQYSERYGKKSGFRYEEYHPHYNERYPKYM